MADALTHLTLERFKDILPLMADWIWEVNAEGKYIFVSGTVKRILGYEPKEMIGKCPFDFMPEPEAKRVQKIFKKIREQKAAITDLENWNLSKTGRRICLLTNGIPIFNRCGELKGYRGVDKDITAQKIAQNALIQSKEAAKATGKSLKRSNQLLRAITKAQSEFISHGDPHQWFDHFLNNLLFITQSEYGFIGEVMYDSVAKVYLKSHAITNIAWNEETKNFYEVNASNGLEFRNLKTLFGAVLTTKKAVISNDPKNDPRSGGCPSGHPPLNSFLGLPFFSGKEMAGMIGIANRPQGYDKPLIHFLQPFLSTCGNLIQGLRTNQQRIQAETKQRTILKTVASGIITIDIHGIIQDFNPAAEKIFNYRSREVIGKNVNILMPEPYHSHHHNYLQSYLSTGKKKIIGIGREVIGKRKDGYCFPLELAVNEMKIGKKTMFTGSLTDISFRKQAEESLITAKEAAERANQIKSDFINIISHELRTPLTVILGNTPLLTNAKDLPAPQEIADIAKDIENDGEHLLALINDLLDISKIEAGKMKLHPISFSAAKLVKETVETIKPLIIPKDLKIDVKTQEIYIYADPMRIKQILLNLLSNAVKFTDHGEIKIRLFKREDSIYFEIQDTGCGIQEEDLPYIFEMFRQADPAGAAQNSSGTGLGLAISLRLIEMHGGKIEVFSQLNVGTTFTVILPLDKENPL